MYNISRKTADTIGGSEKYCEKCMRIIDADRCPHCRHSKVREPEASDLCFLTEQDYIRSGILDDVLKQSSIPFLKKDVMGAGLAIKVGPMLDWSRFYVAFDRLQEALTVVDELFSLPGDSAPDQPE